MENLSEIIITGIAGIILGFIIGFIVFKKFKLMEWLAKQKLNKVIKNPQILKKKLEENGEIYDMGEKIHIGITEDSGGKEILDIKRDPKMKEEKPKKKKKARRKKELSEELMIDKEDSDDQGEMPIEELSEEEIGAEEIPEGEIENLEDLEESGEEDQETEEAPEEEAEEESEEESDKE